LRAIAAAGEAIFDARMNDQRSYYVYLLTNYTNSVVYTGVTNNLIRRVQEHREKLNEGFTKRYAVWKLVYFEAADDPLTAIERAKQIKGGPRAADGRAYRIYQP
jgi:putative endonuclease